MVSSTTISTKWMLLVSTSLWMMMGVVNAGGEEIDEKEEHYKNMFMAHGILMVVAWSVCAPIAIGCSLCRNLLQKKFGLSEGTWFTIHFFTNLMTYILTIISFIIVVVVFQQRGDSHFDADHLKIGLAIVIMVSFQVLGGLMRPAAPHAIHKEDQKDVEEEAQPSKGAASVEMEEKTTIRFIWENCHRILGLVLVALSWYNSQLGIEKQMEDWSAYYPDWTPAFWAVTGVIAGIVFLGFVTDRLVVGRD